MLSSSLQVCITVPRALCIHHHWKSVFNTAPQALCIHHHCASGTVYFSSLYHSSLGITAASLPLCIKHPLQVYISARGPSAASQTPMTWLSNDILPVCIVTMAPICSAYYRKRRTMILQYSSTTYLLASKCYQWTDTTHILYNLCMH